jgi:hypothetical protein
MRSNPSVSSSRGGYGEERYEKNEFQKLVRSCGRAAGRSRVEKESHNRFIDGGIYIRGRSCGQEGLGTGGNSCMHLS